MSGSKERGFMKIKEIRLYKRIISFMLMLVMVFACFSSDKMIFRLQAATYSSGRATFTASGDGYSLTATEAATCSIYTESGQTVLYYTNDSDEEQRVDISGNVIIVGNNIVLNIYSSATKIRASGGTVNYYGDNTIAELEVQAYGTVTIDGTCIANGNLTGALNGSLTINASATVSNLSEKGTLNCDVYNYGTMEYLDKFNCKYAIKLHNYGTIKANTMDLYYYDSDNLTFEDFGEAKYIVKNKFSNICGLKGTVYPDNDDTIIEQKDGGKVTIEYGGVTVVKNDVIAQSTTAGDLIPQAGYSSTSEKTTYYYGTGAVDYSDFLTPFPSDSTLSVQYASSNDGFTEKTTTPPTAIGTYNAYVTVSGTAAYRALVDDEISFAISYLPNSELSGVSCSLSGEQIGTLGDLPLYKDSATLIVPSGWTISSEPDGEFVSTETFDEGYYNGISRYYKRDTDDAISGQRTVYAGAFYVDKNAPVIADDYGWDQDEESVDIVDGCTVNARTLTFTVVDSIGNYASDLDYVTVDGASNGVEIEESGDSMVTLEMTKIGKKTFEVVAVDRVGHSSTWNITLNYKHIDTPDEPYIYSGTEGKNGYFTSDVWVVAKDGYAISDDVNGEFNNRILYNGQDNVYLKNTIDWYTDPIELSKVNIDKIKPVFATAVDESGNKYEITDGMEVHAKELSFAVSDTNLTSVTVNGESVDINNGMATVKLNPEKASKNYVIYAEDIAGNSKSASVTVEYLKEVATANVSMADAFVGMDVKPSLTTNSDGNAAYYYKKVGSSDDTYTTVKPSTKGKYQIQVRIPATDKYTAVTAEDTFELDFLPAPQTSYTVSGKEGKNNFYTSDVELVAPEGYKISDAPDKAYKSSIVYKEGMDKIYLKRDDGALTGAIAFDGKYKIDKLSPEASKTGTFKNNKTQKSMSVAIKNGMSIYADNLDFSIFDENFASITVNGESIEFNEKTAKISLDAENKTVKYNIIAEDKAGNVTSLDIVLKAAWLENNVIPAGANIVLEAGQEYTLEGGKWQVSGDSTIYNGGNSFYVDGTRNCVFTEAK